jgi:hypothetical protein
MSKVVESSVKTLIEARVKRIYGIVGDSLNQITDVIRREKSIQWIHVRHEEVAPFATGAYAHVTGRWQSASGVAVPATFTSSAGSSTAIEAPCRFYQLRHIFRVARRLRLFLVGRGLLASLIAMVVMVGDLVARLGGFGR